MPYTPIILVSPDTIRRCQHESGLTNHKVAELVGVSSATYDRWKHEGRIPRGKHPKLAEVIGLPEGILERDQETEDKLDVVLRELRALQSDVTFLINTIGKG